MGRAKFMSMHLIPMCFHMVGSSCHAPTDVDLDSPSTSTSSKKAPMSPTAMTTSTAAANTIRLIRSDGRVKLYDRPVSAGELMSEFPLHLVCHSDSFCIGQKVPALSESDTLQPGHSYFLLPTHFFQSVLSFVTIASSFAKAATACNTNPAQLLKNFDIRKTPSGALQIRVSDEFIERIRAKEEEEEEGERLKKAKVCTTAALEKDYKQLVRCKSDLWKPKLETISEAEGRLYRKRLEAFGSFHKAMKKRDKEDQSGDVHKKEKKESKQEEKDSNGGLHKKEKKEMKESQKQEKGSGNLQKKEKKVKRVKETQQQKEDSNLLTKEEKKKKKKERKQNEDSNLLTKDEKKKKEKERKQQQQLEKDSYSEHQGQEKGRCEIRSEEREESQRRENDSNNLADEKTKGTQRQEMDAANDHRGLSPPPPIPPPPPSPARSKGKTTEKQKKKGKKS